MVKRNTIKLSSISLSETFFVISFEYLSLTLPLLLSIWALFCLSRDYLQTFHNYFSTSHTKRNELLLIISFFPWQKLKCISWCFGPVLNREILSAQDEMSWKWQKHLKMLTLHFCVRGWKTFWKWSFSVTTTSWKIMWFSCLQTQIQNGLRVCFQIFA